MKEKPLIFITNDDGYEARGIRLLIDILKDKGDVVVVAPKRQQSSTSHSITVGKALVLDEITKQPNYEEYALDGTPVDCVKIALFNILKRKPDYLFAGINHGSNTSINAIYSGTVAAVREGGLEGVNAIGFSLCDNNQDASLKECEPFVRKIIDDVLENKPQQQICWNINIPTGNIKGIKHCHSAKGYWSEEFDTKINEQGKRIYWLGGEYHCLEDSKQADWNAVNDGYVAITPVFGL